MPKWPDHRITNHSISNLHDDHVMRASLIPRLTRLQYLAFIAICLIWGSTWMAIRVLVREVPPLRAAAIRFLLATFLLIVIVLVKKLRWPSSPRQWRALSVLSITFIGVPYGLL